MDPTRINRAQAIEAVRALAQWLEDHPEAPAPNSVRAQHSLFPAAAGHADVVRGVASRLGVEPEVDEDSAWLRIEISPYPIDVSYYVHGRTRAA